MKEKGEKREITDEGEENERGRKNRNDDDFVASLQNLSLSLPLLHPFFRVSHLCMSFLQYEKKQVGKNQAKSGLKKHKYVTYLCTEVFSPYLLIIFPLLIASIQ